MEREIFGGRERLKFVPWHNWEIAQECLTRYLECMTYQFKCTKAVCVFMISTKQINVFLKIYSNISSLAFSRHFIALDLSSPWFHAPAAYSEQRKFFPLFPRVKFPSRLNPIRDGNLTAQSATKTHFYDVTKKGEKENVPFFASEISSLAVFDRKKKTW